MGTRAVTRDEVGRLALLAVHDTPSVGWNNEWLIRFASLVAAAERSECVKVCRDASKRLDGVRDAAFAAEMIELEIRKRDAAS